MNYLMMKEEETEMAKAKVKKQEKVTEDIFGDDDLELEETPEPVKPVVAVVPPIELSSPAPVVEEVNAPGVSKEAVEGILKQVQDSRAVLAGSSSAKVQRAVGKLTEATTWLKDALKDK